MIDLYINLPSRNHYRRPASYASKGYRTRRMAVDFAIPLITNVKVAKLLIEALVRRLPLDVSPIDFQTSHTTHTLPGLVNIAAFVPGLLERGSRDFNEATRASLSGGFTTALVLPFSSQGSITDSSELRIARENARGSGHCNYALSAVVSSKGGALNEDLANQVKCLYLSTDGESNSLPLAALSQSLASWPLDKPIVTDAHGSNLASVLLLASLLGRSIHVSDVQTKEDIQLLSLSKEKKLQLTCDVSIFSLFFDKDGFPNCTSLPTAADRAALWENLSVVDAFSIGRVPYNVARDVANDASAWSGVQEALPLLLTAVGEGRLTMADVVAKLHDNPVKIFGLEPQSDAQVEVVLNRKAIYSASSPSWSPCDGMLVRGGVSRVTIHGSTVFLDGSLFSSPMGSDISNADLPSKPPVNRALRSSMSGGPRPTITSPDSTGQISKAVAVTTAQRLTASELTGPSRETFTTRAPHPAFHRRHILSVKQFAHQDIHDLFDLAHEMRLQVERNGVVDVLKGRVLCSLFYEPSTRTSASFEAAMKRCGGEVVSIAAPTSSVAKGESLADTVRTLSCYGDAIVLRHPEVGSVAAAAKVSPIPILNAGDGVGEHPTQVSLHDTRTREKAQTL
jgi:carbamoyl-phosphate synthase/aspartate carbamoyltransferase